MATYAGQWGPEPFQDRAGNRLPTVAVRVYEPDGTTLSTLYADRLRVGALANPLPTGVGDGVAGLDVDANGLFWAEPGVHIMAASRSGAEVWRSQVMVPIDPAEALSEVPTGGVAGQVLAKDSAVENDVSWATPSTDLGLATDAELAAHVTDPTAAHVASAVAFTPTGTIAATDVQAAIVEAAAEAAAVAEPIATAHIADVSDAHAASAVSNVPAGSVAATTVQAAIDELGTEKEAVGVAAALVDDLSGVTDAATARTNLGLGSAAVLASSAFDPAGSAAAAAAASQPLDADLTSIAALATTGFGRGLLILADAPALRSAAVLGNSAVLNVGTGAGTVAAGDDSRITGAAAVAASVMLNPATHGNLMTGALATTDAIRFKVSGDAADRFVVNADGTLEWGSGAAALDTNLYRGAANRLQTDDTFRAPTLQSSGQVLADTYVGWSNSRLGFGAAPLTTAANTFYNVNGTTIVTAVFRAIASQTADLFQAQNSAAAVLASVSAAGLGSFAGLSITDATNVALSGTTGTKFGTATSQKLAFYDATPIVQGASVADATGGAIIDAEARTALNALISRIEALGLIATV